MRLSSTQEIIQNCDKILNEVKSNLCTIINKITPVFKYPCDIVKDNEKIHLVPPTATEAPF